MRYRYNTPLWIAAIILTHLTSPFARAWYAISHRDLRVQVGTFTYSLKHRSIGSGTVRFGSFTVKSSPKSRPIHLWFEAQGGNVGLFKPELRIVLFSRCPDRIRSHSA